MTDHKTGTREEWLAGGRLNKGEIYVRQGGPRGGVVDSFSKPQSS